LVFLVFPPEIPLTHAGGPKGRSNEPSAQPLGKRILALLRWRNRP
jgi:hypothetical protein